VSAAADPQSAVRIVADGVTVRVRLTPKASRAAIGRLERLADGTEVVIAHVRAAPSEGAANAALLRLFADELRIAKSKVELVAGATARLKTVRIAGDGAALAEALARLAAAAK
jgi:uncharacterized protein (TIGR00251 family)